MHNLRLAAVTSAPSSGAINIDATGRVGIGTTSPTQTLEVSGKVKSTNLRQMVSASNAVTTTSTTWADLMSMTVNGSGLPVSISAVIGGVYGNTTNMFYFQLLIDDVSVAISSHQTPSYVVMPCVLQWIQTLSSGSHTIKVQWKTVGGTIAASYDSALRSIMVSE